MNYDNFIDDVNTFESLQNWKNDMYPDNTMIVYIRYKSGRRFRDEIKFATMMWKINKSSSLLYGNKSEISEILSITVYDWETKEKIGTYDSEQFKNLWYDRKF